MAYLCTQGYVYCGVAWTAGNQEDVTQAEKGKEKQAEEGSRYG